MESSGSWKPFGGFRCHLPHPRRSRQPRTPALHAPASHAVIAASARVPVDAGFSLLLAGLIVTGVPGLFFLRGLASPLQRLSSFRFRTGSITVILCRISPAASQTERAGHSGPRMLAEQRNRCLLRLPKLGETPNRPHGQRGCN
eukprot:2353625-Rhodomonas_salina.2